jgi:hypothetical protein
MRNLRVRFQIDIYAIEHDPFAIRRRHRRADALQFHHVLEGEWSPQGAPKKPLAANSQSQRFQRLKQTGAVIQVPDFYSTKFLGHPRAGFTDSAFLGTEFPNQIAQRFLIGLDVTAPVAKDLSEPILRMVLDHRFE